MTALDREAAGAALARLEERLAPAQPESAGLTVLAYGEISAALLVDDEPSLDGYVVKRMSGFGDDHAATQYVSLLREYLHRLAEMRLRTLATEPITIHRPGMGPTVFLMQPLQERDLLGNQVLHDADDDQLAAALTAVLGQVATVLSANAEHPEDEISIDAQLSNWVFGDGDPVLIDVGTPFIRRGGSHAFDQEILLSAVPPLIRNYYRWKGTASEYMDDYFDARLIAVDILGNFHKEGAAERLPTGLRAVNDWLAGPGSTLPQASGDSGHVTAQEVAEYYKQDAATLELFLRVRRMDRAVRRAIRRPYDFILPGPVQR